MKAIIFPLLACVRARRVEAVLVAFDLHRLNAGTLAELAQTRVPMCISVFSANSSARSTTCATSKA